MFSWPQLQEFVSALASNMIWSEAWHLCGSSLCPCFGTCGGDLCVGRFVIFPIILGMSYPQLTNSYFSEGLKPPTSQYFLGVWGVGSNPEYLDTDHIWKYNAFNLSEIRIFYQIPPYFTIVYQILLYMFHISYHILPKLAFGISTYKTGWFWTRAHVGKYSSTMVRRVQILNGLVFQGKLKPEKPIIHIFHGKIDGLSGDFPNQSIEIQGFPRPVPKEMSKAMPCSFTAWRIQRWFGANFGPSF